MIIESLNTIPWINISHIYTAGMYGTLEKTPFPNYSPHLPGKPYPCLKPWLQRRQQKTLSSQSHQFHTKGTLSWVGQSPDLVPVLKGFAGAEGEKQDTAKHCEPCVRRKSFCWTSKPVISCPWKLFSLSSSKLDVMGHTSSRLYSTRSS